MLVRMAKELPDTGVFSSSVFFCLLIADHFCDKLEFIAEKDVFMFGF